MTVAQLTHKTYGREVLAEFDGTCVKCRGPIEARVDYIRKVDGIRGIFHSRCAVEICQEINGELDALEDLGSLGRLPSPPLKACDRQSCRCSLEHAEAAYLFTDKEADRLVVFCDRCARVAEELHGDRFEVVVL